MSAYKSIPPDEQRLVQNQPLDDLHAPRGGEAALVVVEPGEVAVRRTGFDWHITWMIYHMMDICCDPHLMEETKSMSLASMSM